VKRGAISAPKYGHRVESVAGALFGKVRSVCEYESSRIGFWDTPSGSNAQVIKILK
jgi:hypothetical protein